MNPSFLRRPMSLTWTTVGSSANLLVQIRHLESRNANKCATTRRDTRESVRSAEAALTVLTCFFVEGR